MHDTVLGTLHFDVDHLGTPKGLFDGSGEKLWQAEHSVYGQIESERSFKLHPVTGEHVAPKLRFQGQYEDSESGLLYNLNRYYDAEVSRYTTQDPIGLLGGLNAYQYCPNPVGWVDPLGLASKDCDSATQPTVNSPVDFDYEALKAEGSRYIYDPRLNTPGGRDVYRDTLTGWAVRASDLDWPTPDYVPGTQKYEELDIGTVIERVGHPGGSFGALGNDSISVRGLPPGSQYREAHRYRVKAKGVTGQTSEAALVPQFNATGGARQFEADESYADLLAADKIEEID